MSGFLAFLIFFGCLLICAQCGCITAAPDEHAALCHAARLLAEEEHLAEEAGEAAAAQEALSPLADSAEAAIASLASEAREVHSLHQRLLAARLVLMRATRVSTSSLPRPTPEKA